jgi:DNA-binding beta-propeller fold protein YncE
MKRFLALCVLGCSALLAQQPSESTELPGKPFYVKQTWIIGGEGNWDYMAMDPVALQLIVAHGAVVQVVDVTTGTVAGEISGMSEAHGIALGDTGEFGYVSDGPANRVRVFDRRSLKVVASIPTGPNPRAIVFEPQNRLVFAVSSNAQPRNPGPGMPAGSRSAADQGIKSTVTVIDAQTRAVIATILLPGRLGFAQTGGRGQVYVSIVDRNEIARLDVEAILTGLHELPAKADAGRPEPVQSKPAPPKSAAHKPVASRPAQPGEASVDIAGVTLDWSGLPRSTQPSGNRVRFLPIPAECSDLRSLAVDAANERLFAACGNMKMVVLNAATGELVASLPIGPGTDAIGYDPGRGLIYTANGAAQGSLTIMHQHVTDTYAVIQNLPTQQRARTLAVNPVSGEVYLVTDLLGMNLEHAGGIGTLRTDPAKGSFQVLVIGH